MPGADPGFQVGGGYIKKLRWAEGGAQIFGYFRERAPGAPSQIRPCMQLQFLQIVSLKITLICALNICDFHLISLFIFYTSIVSYLL